MQAVRSCRESNGRFAKGHDGGPGRPRRSVEQEYLATLNGVVTLEVWQAIVERAVQHALEGDAKARDFLAAYVIGNNRLSLLELAINERAGMTADVVIDAHAAGQKLRVGLLNLQSAVASQITSES